MGTGMGMGTGTGMGGIIVQAINQVINVAERGFCYLVEHPAYFATTITTLFQSIIMHRMQSDSSVAPHYHKVTYFLGLTSLGIAAAKTWELLPEKNNLSASVAVIALTAVLALSYIHRISKPTLPALTEKEQRTIQLSWKSPSEVRRAIFIQQIPLIQNIILSCFLPTQRLKLAIEILCQSYSYVHLVKLKWFCLKKITFLKDEQEQLFTITFIYTKLMLNTSFKREDNEGRCVICWDNIANTHFCKRHIYCLSCIANHTKTQSSQFIDDIHLNTTNHFVLNTSTLPKCPECKGSPIDEKFEACISTFQSSTLITASAPNVSEPPIKAFKKIFEDISLVYGIFQACLTSLQHNHIELTNVILAMRRWMIISDMTLLAGDVINLYNESTTLHTNQRIATYLKTATFIIITTTAAVIGLNYLMTPTINLNLLSSKILPNAVKPFTCRNFTWNRPNIENFMLWILACRLVINFLSLWITNNRKQKLIQLGLQALALFQNARLPWVTASFCDHFSTVSFYTRYSYILQPGTISFGTILNKSLLGNQLKFMNEYANQFYAGASYTFHKYAAQHSDFWYCILKTLAKVPKAIAGDGTPALDQWITGLGCHPNWGHGDLQISFPS